MRESWSQLIASRYALRLPPDFAQWLDEEPWRRVNQGGVRVALTPDEMLEPPPGTIWGGFMLPDTLPVLGNEYGDWLCLRVSPDNTISEYVYWSHAGGDWLPFGETWPAAVLFEASNIYRGPHSASWLDTQDASAERRLAATWALTVLGTSESLESLWPTAEATWEVCQTRGWGSDALHHQAVLRVLQNLLRRELNPHVAKQLGFEWEPDVVRWMFDSALMPAAVRETFARHFKTSADALAAQDWDAAERLALTVLARRRDLAWASDIAGWSAERRGDLDLAADRYWRGLHASLFSDYGVSFRSHWFDEGFGKFSAARLNTLADRLTPEQQAEPYLQVLWKNDPESLRARVRDFWLEQADSAAEASRDSEAYDALYRAGWDLGLQYVHSYGEILARMEEFADRAGATGRARLAALHRAHVLGH